MSTKLNIKHISSTELYNVLPTVAKLKIKNNCAKLPDNFKILVSLETQPQIKPFYEIDKNKVKSIVLRKISEYYMNIPAEQFEYKRRYSRNRNLIFCIYNDKILIGSKHKNGFMKLIQRIKDLINPTILILKYYGG